MIHSVCVVIDVVVDGGRLLFQPYTGSLLETRGDHVCLCWITRPIENFCFRNTYIYVLMQPIEVETLGLLVNLYTTTTQNYGPQ